jgi:TrmH family RNA methyltransferase
VIITRRSHPLLKELRDIRDRTPFGLLFLEGPKLVDEAIKASISLKTLIYAEDFKNLDLLNRAKSRANSLFAVSASIFKSVSDLVEPQGILAIGEGPRWSWEQLLISKPAPILVLDGLQNPGNVSAVVRTAEAAGAAGIVTTPGTARLTSPKALRGASGSILRVPNLEHQRPDDILQQLSTSGYTVYAADKTAGRNYTQLNWNQPIAVVLGQEGGGISDHWKAEVVTIPMEKPVESLNVAAAAAVMLYEAYRQRRAAR